MNVRKPRIFIFTAIAAAVLPLTFHSGQEPSFETTQPIHLSGYVARLDPATKEFISAPDSPASLPNDEILQHTLSTSSEGLMEAPSPVAGGGMMVHLQGRFQNVFAASRNDSGRVHADCSSGEHRGPCCEDGTR